MKLNVILNRVRVIITQQYTYTFPVIQCYLLKVRPYRQKQAKVNFEILGHFASVMFQTCGKMFKIRLGVYFTTLSLQFSHKFTMCERVFVTVLLWLCSAEGHTCCVNQLLVLMCFRYCGRAFCSAAPRLWNAVPDHLSLKKDLQNISCQQNL